MLCVVKMSVVMLGIVMLSVMLNVTYKPSMLSVVEPYEQLKVNLMLGFVSGENIYDWMQSSILNAQMPK